MSCRKTPVREYLTYRSAFQRDDRRPASGRAGGRAGVHPVPVVIIRRIPKDARGQGRVVGGAVAHPSWAAGRRWRALAMGPRVRRVIPRARRLALFVETDGGLHLCIARPRIIVVITVNKTAKPRYSIGPAGTRNPFEGRVHVTMVPSVAPWDSGRRETR